VRKREEKDVNALELPFRIFVDKLLLIPEDHDSLPRDVESKLRPLALPESSQVDTRPDFDTEFRRNARNDGVGKERFGFRVVEGLVTNVDVLKGSERRLLRDGGVVREEAGVFVGLGRKRRGQLRAE
jgi:hypothetical protein